MKLSGDEIVDVLTQAGASEGGGSERAGVTHTHSIRRQTHTTTQYVVRRVQRTVQYCLGSRQMITHGKGGCRGRGYLNFEPS